MSRRVEQPWPSTMSVNGQHAWMPFPCGGCGAVVGYSPDFDADRIPPSILCSSCADWYEIVCNRCRRSLGFCPAPHSGPVTYCPECARSDETAPRKRARRVADATPAVEIETEGGGHE